MRSTLLKTAVAATVGLSVAGCSDSLAPTETEAPTLEAVSVQANPPGFARGGLYGGTWSGTLELSPGQWTWELEQQGRTVTGTVDPAPNLPGTLTGTLKGQVLSVLIEYPNGAINVGEMTLDRPPFSFSGELVLILPNLPIEIPFGTEMQRDDRPGRGNRGPATLSASAAGSAPEGLAARYNVDGTLVDGPDSN